MTYCKRLSYSFLSSRAKQKAGSPKLEWEDVEKKDLRKIRISWKGVEGSFELIGVEEKRA